MKSEDLLKRRKKLQEEVIRVSSRLQETGRQFEQKSLENFIESDKIASEGEGQAILKDFQDRLSYLQRMGQNLNREIEVSRRKERLKTLKRKVKEIEDIRQRRVSLWQRAKKLEKKIKEIQAESRSLNEKLQLMKGEKNLLSVSETTVHMRLNKVRGWLEKNFVRDEQKLLARVEAIKEQNKEVWTGSQAREEIIRNVEIRYDVDSGKILKISFSGMSLDRLRDSEHKDLFLIESLIKGGE